MAETPARKLPPQFGMRTMLGLMVVASVLYAIANWFGPGIALLLGFFLLLVFVHIWANSWGGEHFRPTTPLPEYVEPEAGPLSRSEAQHTAEALRAEAHERIGRIRLGWMTLLVTLGGAIGGGAAGNAMGRVCFDPAQPNSFNGLVIATLSAGVLGGFLGFWCGSFLQIFYEMNVAGWEGARKKTPPHKPAP